MDRLPQDIICIILFDVENLELRLVNKKFNHASNLVVNKILKELKEEYSGLNPDKILLKSLWTGKKYAFISLGKIDEKKIRVTTKNWLKFSKFKKMDIFFLEKD